MKRVLLATFLLHAAWSGHAQTDRSADSLDIWLSSETSDTARALFLIQLLEETSDPSSMHANAEQRLLALVDRLDGSPIRAVRRVARRVRSRHFYVQGRSMVFASNYAEGLQCFLRGWALVSDDATPDESLIHCLRMQRLYELAGDTSRMVNFALSGITHASQVQDTNALLWLMQSVARVRPNSIELDSIQHLGDLHYKHKDEEDRAFFHWNMALTMMRQGRNDEARVRLRNMIRSHQGKPPTASYALAHWTLGEVYGSLDSLREGIATLQEAIRLAEGIGMLQWSGAERRMLGDQLSRLGLENEAEEAWLKAAAELRVNNIIEEEFKAVEGLKDLYERTGRYKESLAMTHRWILLKDSMDRMDHARSSMRMEFKDQVQADSIANIQRMHEQEVRSEIMVGRERLRRNVLLGVGSGLLVFAVVVWRQRDRIGKERQRSERLLLNILPHKVAEELKAKGEAEAVHIDQVTVLFTDFKGFTAMSEQVTPRQLVHDLHECFSAFDRICEEHGIEKIKTIGDAYMAAGGLPTPNTTHATDVIIAALAMRDFIAEGKARKLAAGLPYFEIRIGVHTGPVVAGIVGVKKFQYDI
ncbi:MAG: adenylate/guanylate cyclase domain-containing protein, partial [Flavobacteriales bacterium]|nr:adenylate/guanylate cyclase domain-containing protein [Flavobacteriales bacterium]